MPRIDPLRRARWADPPSIWPGPLDDDAFTRLNALLEPLADAEQLLDACDDASQHARAQLVLGILHRGPTPRSLEEAGLTLSSGTSVALADAGPEPVPSAVRRSLDRVFAGDSWALRVRSPLPEDADLEPVKQALRVWRMASSGPSTVNYDHDGVALEFTLLHPLSGGLRSVVGPRRRPPLEVLDRALAARPDAAVVAVRSGQIFGRHALQQALYGPASTVRALSTPTGRSYEATVEADGWLARRDRVAEVWWLDPQPAPFGRLRRMINPWGPACSTGLRAERTCVAAPDEDGAAVLRWVRGEGEG